MFKHKIILITGGSSGIGKSIALLFAKNNGSIIFTYKDNKNGADNVIREIKENRGEALALQSDLINENEAKEVVAKIMSKFGRIDVLINNAGRYINGDEWNGSSDVWMKSLQQNLVSMMNVSKFVIEIFQKQKSGIMVNIASRYSMEGHFEALSYGAAKAGVVNITQAYAKLLTPFGRANVISPSAVKAGYWLNAPKEELKIQGKLISPEKIAEKVLFLASEDSKNINGQNILMSE